MLKVPLVSWYTRPQAKFQYVQNILAQQRQFQMLKEFSLSLLELASLLFIKPYCQLLTIPKIKHKLFFFSVIVSNTISSFVNSLRLCNQGLNLSICWILLLNNGRDWQVESTQKYWIASSLLMIPILITFHVDLLLLAQQWKRYLKSIRNLSTLKFDEFINKQINSEMILYQAFFIR